MSAASSKYASSALSRPNRRKTAKPKPTTGFWASPFTPTITRICNPSSDVSKTLLDQVEEFFVSYNKQRGKKFKITGTGGPKKALKFLKDGIKAHKNAGKK